MSVSDETSTVTDGIILSDAAAAKVKALLDTRHYETGQRFAEQAMKAVHAAFLE